MKRKNFGFFAYNPPTSGVYTINGCKYKSDEDFRSVKRCKEYKSVGFDVLQLRYEYMFTGEEPWETSRTKYMWDIAYKAGIKKVLVTDLRIDRLIRAGHLIGDGYGYKFKSEKELDDKISEYVSLYKDKKGFYGLQLVDEPSFYEIPSYGEVARSLKRVVPKAYLQINLNPIGLKCHEISDPIKAYEKYVGDILDLTGADGVSFDDYPFRREYIISGYNILAYQIVARICKGKGRELRTVLQSFSHATQGVLRTRRVNESDMYWQTNLAMGFGAREYAFYTYMPKSDFAFISGGDGIDGACFINNDGSRTALFNYTKRIIKEMQTFSKVALKYNYNCSYVITEKGKTKSDFEWTKNTEDYGECPIPIKIDKGVALVTEQRSGADSLYMVENIGNVKDELFDNAPPMEIEVVLPDGENTIYYRGKKTERNEKDKIYRYHLKVGDAIFIETKK